MGGAGRVRASLFLLAVTVMAATGACRRSSVGGRDAPAADVSNVIDDEDARDIGVGGDPPDAPEPDGGRDALDAHDVDGSSDDDAGDAADGAPSVSCESVRALAARGVLTSRRSRQVLFTRGGVVLRVAGEVAFDGGFIPDDVVFVRLPDGAITTLVRGASAVEALGASAEMLVTSALTGALLVASPSTGEVRSLGGAGCDHVTAPDGSRVFVTVGCDLTRTPRPVDELDVRSGVSTRIASRVGYRSLVVSPGGAQAAYLSIPDSGDAG